jgi:hypothetical protein
MSFATPVDICNRALQHCGVSRINGFTDDTLQASECQFTYDKVRRAELRRNVWQFSIRKVALRPIDTQTMLIAPELWSNSTTYAYGALVTDVSGMIWQSRIQDNLNNNPTDANNTTSYAWESYVGPMTAEPYDTTGTTNYYAGELVYETPGDGTYIVYMSLQSGNSADPRVPTLWLNTTTYEDDAVVEYWAAWAIGTTYAAGNTVSYNGISYISLVGGNVGHEPDISPVQWALVPTVPAPAYYSSITTYSIGQWVTDATGKNYVSLQNSNTAHTPSSSPTWWLVQATPVYYSSLVDENLNNEPDTSPTKWTSTNYFGDAGDTWLTISVLLVDLNIIYPIGTGPCYQSFTRNVFRLPSGFLRRAPQDPKAGSTSFLGAPSGLRYDDWTMEGKYITSIDTNPILLRFAADVTDVALFDDMFCELVAARVGMEVVERLTQSTAKLQSIAAMYKQFGGEARIINGIETGPTEPPEDDFITCRL